MVAPSTLTELPLVVRYVTNALGFRYVLLHRFVDAPGRLKSSQPLRAEQGQDLVGVAGEEGFEPSTP